MMMNKVYDIRKIDELHRLRADIYEERKHLSAAERRAISNDDGRKIYEILQTTKTARQ